MYDYSCGENQNMKSSQNPRKSKIFSNLEIEALEERLKGSRKDPFSIYGCRVKPKIKELLEWFKRKKELERLINQPDARFLSRSKRKNH